MQDMINSLYNIRHLDDLARKETPIHGLHPLAKLITTVIFLTVVVSFGRYETGRLLPFFFYPVIVFAFAELPAGVMLKRILIAEPFILAIGILNPLFETQTVAIGGMVVSRGWITFLSIFLKGGLTVAAALLLVATTGMDRLGAALRMLKVPRIFVLQLLLTYRYIWVLTEEVARMLRAYALRSPQQKGIHISAWGSFAGQLILRTFDRAQRVYEAMCLRGFAGEYNTGAEVKIKAADFLYVAGWGLFFAAARTYDIPMLIGTWVTAIGG